MLFRRLAVSLTVLTSVALGTSFIVAALPANAAGEIQCDPDLCIQRITAYSGYFTVDTWADTSNFYGHFEIYDADNKQYNSTPNQEWYAGGAHHQFKIIYQGGNCYQAIAWRHNSNGSYTDVGNVCFNVSPP